MNVSSFDAYEACISSKSSSVINVLSTYSIVAQLSIFSFNSFIFSDVAIDDIVSCNSDKSSLVE